MMEFLTLGLPEEVARAKERGDFAQVRGLINYLLSKELPVLHRMRLEFELVRLERVEETYVYSLKEAMALAKEAIVDFTDDEFFKYYNLGVIDYIILNGEVRFEKRFIDNLGFQFPEIGKRMEESENQKRARNLLEERIKALIKGDKPRAYRVRAKVSYHIKSPKGKRVRVWLPLPRLTPAQDDIQVLSVSHEPVFIAKENYPQRTIYFEGKDTEEFFVEFSYLTRERWNPALYERISSSAEGGCTGENVCNERHTDSNVMEYPPHITFTPSLKLISNEIISPNDPMILKVEKIYNFVTKRVRYSYVRPYIFYDHIPEFVCCNLKGDCGFQALLFITLCRMNGIPARWESGWYINPYVASSHDWAMIKFEEYGWVPVDLSFGGKKNTGDERRLFYLGNLDGFRMIANDAFQREFDPPTNFVRCDPYDNQVGESEYFDGKAYGDTRITVVDFQEV